MFGQRVIFCEGGCVSRRRELWRAAGTEAEEEEEGALLSDAHDSRYKHFQSPGKRLLVPIVSVVGVLCAKLLLGTRRLY